MRRFSRALDDLFFLKFATMPDGSYNENIRLDHYNENFPNDDFADDNLEATQKLRELMPKLVPTIRSTNARLRNAVVRGGYLTTQHTGERKNRVAGMSGGGSFGLYDPACRRQAEEEHHGLEDGNPEGEDYDDYEKPEDDRVWRWSEGGPGTDPRHYPTYGVMDKPEFGHNPAQWQYGNIRLKLKNDPETRGRVTFTYGDSLGTHAQPSPIDDPRSHSIIGARNPYSSGYGIRGFMDDVDLHDEDAPGVYGAREYIEAQIHPKHGSRGESSRSVWIGQRPDGTPGDVEHVDFPHDMLHPDDPDSVKPGWGSEAATRHVLDYLDKNGITYRFHRYDPERYPDLAGTSVVKEA